MKVHMTDGIASTIRCDKCLIILHQFFADKIKMYPGEYMRIVTTEKNYCKRCYDSLDVNSIENKIAVLMRD